jgi:hypothetical protein
MIAALLRTTSSMHAPTLADIVDDAASFLVEAGVRGERGGFERLSRSFGAFV